MGIGHEKTIQEVIEQAEDNDSWNQGIEKIGVVSDISSLISNFNKN